MDAKAKNFWINIVIGLSLIIIATVVVLWLIRYGVGDSAKIFRIFDYIAILSLLLYSIAMFFLRFGNYLDKHTDNSMSKFAQDVLAHWFKWLIFIFLLLVYMLLSLEYLTGTM